MILSVSSPLAVNITTGVREVAGSVRIFRSRSSPSIPGSRMSRRISSGSSVLAFSHPVSPSGATVGENPSLRREWASRSRISFSSSTMRMDRPTASSGGIRSGPIIYGRGRGGGTGTYRWCPTAGRRISPGTERNLVPRLCRGGPCRFLLGVGGRHDDPDEGVRHLEPDGKRPEIIPVHLGGGGDPGTDENRRRLLDQDVRGSGMLPPEDVPGELEDRPSTGPAQGDHLERVPLEVPGRRDDHPAPVFFPPADDDGLRLHPLLSRHLHPEARLLPEEMSRPPPDIRPDAEGVLAPDAHP